MAWHPSGRYAITTGTEADVVGIATDRSWTPLLHEGPDLEGCAMHPDGEMALGVGEEGSVLRIPHDPAPMVTVVHPTPGSLVAPQEDQRFLLDVIDRGGAGNVSVTGTVVGTDVTADGFLSGPWWELRMDTRNLSQGDQELAVEVATAAGEARVTHPFLVNPDRFTPETPEILEPTGLEGDGHSTSGAFTIRWETLDEPVHYQVRQEHQGEGSNGTRILDAGDADRLPVQVHEEGVYTFSVRALNAFNASDWSSNVVVNVVFDDGAPTRGDRDFRECPSPDEASDVSWRECVLGVERDNEDGSNANDSDTEDSNESAGGEGVLPVPVPGLALLSPALAALLSVGWDRVRSRRR